MSQPTVNFSSPLLHNFCDVNKTAKLKDRNIDTTLHQYYTITMRTCKWPFINLLEALFVLR